MNDGYEKYLASPTWARLRDARFAIDDHKCQMCGSGSQLCVHHLVYPEKLGAENVKQDLVTLCKNCRGMVHRCVNAAKTINTQTEIVGFISSEIYMRDISTGGDLKLFDDGMRTAYKLIDFIQWMLPEWEQGLMSPDLINQIRLFRSNKICQLYRQEWTINEIAIRCGVKPDKIQKVLERHGFTDGAKIRR